MLAYLLEIGCEEIPAGFIPSSSEYLKTEISKQLNNFSLAYGSVHTGGTPRRMYAYICDLNDRQTDRLETIVGPPAKIAFNEDGSLTDVARKFIESKGLDSATVVKISTPKGEYLQGEKKTGGESAKDILTRVIPDIIRNMPFPKSMKWGDGDFRFARPIHWFLSVLSGESLPFEIDGIKSGNVTYGHRFMAPEMIIVTDFEQYKSALAQAFVVIDGSDRRAMIKQQLEDIATEGEFSIHAEEGLLATVEGLVEYPHAVLGSFDAQFLALPQEVLITSMKVHQKYFPVMDKDGALLNHFVGVSNTVPQDSDDLIRRGYERVLKARLNDAMFFFNNDKKTKLTDMAEKLKKVVYQEKLGTSYEKMERFRALAVFLAEKFAPESVENIRTVATLAKADLMSEMVYEFPELQGIMGSYYAKFEQLPENIWQGIHEHYLPKFAGDVLPTTDEGRLVSIADKLDTIAGAFAAGMIPTGNLDPYGLRRSTIGILNMLENAEMRLDMQEIVEIALRNFENKLQFNKAETAGKILAFISQRWKQMLVSRGESDADVYDAVAGMYTDSLAVAGLAKVLTKARGSDNFAVIAASFKRINNILKKSGWDNAQYDESLFETDEERALAALIQQQGIAELIAQEKNYAALDELMKFAPVLNAFFDGVMVMAEDEAVRANRLSLISALRAVFMSVGNLDALS